MDWVEKQHNIKSEMLFELVYIKMAKIVPQMAKLTNQFLIFNIPVL